MRTVDGPIGRDILQNFELLFGCCDAVRSESRSEKRLW